MGQCGSGRAAGMTIPACGMADRWKDGLEAK
jgi:hypothetical protein